MSETVGKPPEKFLPREEWSASQEFTYALNGCKPLNPEWTEYRDDVLSEHGLLDDNERDDDE